MEVTFGNETKTWYLTVTKAITDSLKEIEMKELLKEESRLVNSLARLSVNRCEHPFYRHKMLILSHEKIEYSNKTKYLCYGKRIKQLRGDRGEHSG